MPQEGGSRSWGRLLLAALAAFAVAALLYRLLCTGLPAGQESRFFYLSALLALLLAGVLGRLAMAPRSALRWALGHAVTWLAVGLVLVAGYSYRRELNQVTLRVIGELLPARGQPVVVVKAEPGAAAAAPARSYARSMRFTMASDGQFHVEAVIGATVVRFILDTGASEVMLSQADARRLGYEPGNLSYTQLYRTASGIVRGARVILPTVDIGPIRVTDVNASVLETDTEVSLLGMTFLSRLSSYQVDGPTLTLMQ